MYHVDQIKKGLDNWWHWPYSSLQDFDRKAGNSDPVWYDVMSSLLLWEKTSGLSSEK